MGCYRTILVGYDGSTEAEAAVRHAASLACDQNAKLVLLTVIPHVPCNPVVPATAAVARDIEGEFVRSLHRVTAAVPGDVGVECRIAHGKAAARILEVARDLRADLIVLGSHGHGRLHDALARCTSAAVTRESDIPVLLVRGKDAAVAAAPDPVEAPAVEKA